MGSLVLELQRDAMDANIKVADLLRKAFVVAKKLGIKEFEEWIQQEMNGYTKKTEVPDYREIYGELKCHNPYQGWVPLDVRDPELADKLSKRKTTQSIGQLEHLLSTAGPYHIDFEKSLERELMNGMEFPMRPTVMAQATQIHGIVDGVRNIVLEWALRLESEGILGEGMTFSPAEKSAAASGSLHIQNFIQSMSHSQIQQDSPGGTQTNTFEQALDVEKLIALLAEIRQHANEFGLSPELRDELVADVAAAEAQAKSPKPKWPIVKAATQSVKSILERAASGVLLHELLTRLKDFL